MTENASISPISMGTVSSNPVAGATDQDLMNQLRHRVNKDIARDDGYKTALECLLIDVEAIIASSGDAGDHLDSADLIDGDGFVLPLSSKRARLAQMIGLAEALKELLDVE